MLNMFDKIILNFEKYGLHDATMNNVELYQDGLNLIFDNGIYLLDENGKEKNLTGKCNIELKISNFDCKNILEKIEINRIYKRKISELNLEEFLKLLNKGNFEIEYNFVSNFNNIILLKGFIGKNKFEFLVSDIVELKLNFI